MSVISPNFLNHIVHGDCLQLFPKLPDESVDCIITDPPYNIANTTKLTKVGEKIVTTADAWGKSFADAYTDDEFMVFMAKIAEQCYRVLKNGGSLLIYFDRSKPIYLLRFYQLFTFKNMIAFVKTNPLCHVRKNNYRSGFEQCAWFVKGESADHFHFLRQNQMVNVFYGNIGQKETTHETEKYRWMIDPLITRHSNPNDIVLDPFCGSGTTIEACLVFQRQFIGFELNPKYCQIAARRIAKWAGVSRITEW